MRLQSALVNSEKVQAAQNTISKAYKGIQDQLSGLLTVTSKENRDAMLHNISNLANEYKQAAEIAFPRFKSFVVGAVSQLQYLTQELKNVTFLTILFLHILVSIYFILPSFPSSYDSRIVIH